MRRTIRVALAAFALTAMAGTASAASDPPGGVPLPEHKCQRACLEGYVNKYLAAMAAHKVDPALFAQHVRFTENGVEMPFGTEGLWATASGVGKYKLYVPDPETQQVAFLGTVLETASSSATGPARAPDLVGLALRLRIGEDGRITEVEQIAARPDRPLGAGPATPSSNPFPATGEAVERNTGHDYYPFTDDCLRHENGVVTAASDGRIGIRGQPAQSCRKQLETSLIGAVTSIRDRRFVAVDRERGVVFSFAFFDHRPINWTWQLGELFKIENDKISRIEAIFIRGPYGVCSGWSTYEQCRSEEPQDVR
jgi:hypothetical protein